MNPGVSYRVRSTGAYYFSAKRSEIDAIERRGLKVLNLGIGNPDMAPAPSVLSALVGGALMPGSHGYQPYSGIDEFRQAIKKWHRIQHNTILDASAGILPLMGSKEGIIQISLAYLNPGDAVLIPDPGYPAYAAAANLAGAEVIRYRLREENGWLPEMDELDVLLKSHIKIMWINYPHMPTGRCATAALLTELVQWARDRGILLVNDNPYNLILNKNPLSLLSIAHAKHSCLELHSLSKSHNMAGWRIGWLAGAKELVEPVRVINSNMDSGMFQPIQRAAAQALMCGDEWLNDLNGIYMKRRTMALKLARRLNGSADMRNKAGLFVWARLPKGVDDHVFCDRLLHRKGIFITPGSVFGKGGKGYVRISLCCPDNVFNEAMGRTTEIKSPEPVSLS